MLDEKTQLALAIAQLVRDINPQLKEKGKHSAKPSNMPIDQN